MIKHIFSVFILIEDEYIGVIFGFTYKMWWDSLPMAQCEKDVTPLLMHWNHIFLALIHRYITWKHSGLNIHMSKKI